MEASAPERSLRCQSKEGRSEGEREKPKYRQGRTLSQQG